MRRQLDDNIELARRQGNALRRFGIPAIAAVVVAALAAGGYLLYGGGSNNPSYQPAGGAGSPTTSETPRAEKGKDKQSKKTPGPATKGSKPKGAESAAILDPAKAYQKCIDFIQDDPSGEPPSEKPVGKLAIENTHGITVVVANSKDSYTCNIKPDMAVSHPEKLDGKHQAEDFWFALNYWGNYVPGKDGDIVWAGGQVPDGVTGITYKFSDGHAEQAVLKDGFWAMQYYAEKSIPNKPDLEVVLAGPKGKTYQLDMLDGTAMCNQVSHGC